MFADDVDGGAKDEWFVCMFYVVSGWSWYCGRYIQLDDVNNRGSIRLCLLFCLPIKYLCGIILGEVVALCYGEFIDVSE